MFQIITKNVKMVHQMYKNTYVDNLRLNDESINLVLTRNPLVSTTHFSFTLFKFLTKHTHSFRIHIALLKKKKKTTCVHLTIKGSHVNKGVVLNVGCGIKYTSISPLHRCQPIQPHCITTATNMMQKPTACIVGMELVASSCVQIFSC